MRRVSTAVLPEPAAAETARALPRASIAAFWLGVQLILAIIASCKQSILYYYIFIFGLCQQHFS
jgi:hypothetical protein